MSEAGSAAPCRGLDVDPQSRCRHWHSPVDIVAMRFKCCGEFYACHDCHSALAGHEAARWSPADAGEVVARCGACGHPMTLPAYLACGDACPACHAAFNPGCRNHRHLYFDTSAC